MQSNDGPPEFEKSRRLVSRSCFVMWQTVTVGDPDAASSDEEIDIQTRFRAMCHDEVSPSNLIILDDNCLMPSNSSAGLIREQVQMLLSSEFDPLAADPFAEQTHCKSPKVINGYMFGEVLGEGSYSKVKEVLDTRTLIRRSVKIIKDKRLRKIPFGEKNVQHEIYILQQIQHQNVVRLLETFRVEEKQKLYLIMEYCTGSLQQLLDQTQEKKLPEFQCHGYFVQLLDGIDYLHQRGIIHKDIKPGNLLISLEGIIKICDMGVAELLEDPSNDWCTLCQGTLKFQPPEVVSGNSERFRGRLVDVWACGVTLFNLITGDYPFNGETIIKLYENIAESPINWPLDVVEKPDLKALLSGMLEKEAEKRYNTVAVRSSPWFGREFAVDLGLIVQPEPEKVATPQQWLTNSPPVARSPSPPSLPPGQPGSPSRPRSLISRLCPWRRR